MQHLCFIIILFIAPLFTCGYYDASSTLSTSLSSKRNLSIKLYAKDNNEDEMEKFISKAPPISWYPGHIAKAERELSAYIKKVDVVIELRDARIPLATAHPKVSEWVGKKPLIVAMGRIDQISRRALSDWKKYYATHPVYPGTNSTVYFLDGKQGTGAQSLKTAAIRTGHAINERRVRRGTIARPIRAAIIGFPNVGKSALINRLLGKRLAKSQNLPGVTKSLQWVRLSEPTSRPENSLELLDSPGIIPARQSDQDAAMKLAICNDIGEASYDRVVVAVRMCDLLNDMNRIAQPFIDMDYIIDRYKIPFSEMTGEEIVAELSLKSYHGNEMAAADRLLSDFRNNLLRYGSLESPPWGNMKHKYPTPQIPPFESILEKNPSIGVAVSDILQKIHESRSETEAVKEEKVVEDHMNKPKPPDDGSIDLSQIGRGLYDGW